MWSFITAILKRRILIVLSVFFFQPNWGTAQNLWGVQAGNTLSLPRGIGSEIFKDGVLLRSSLGIIGRKRIADNLKARLIAPMLKGVIELDYGMNVVFTGFDYRFGNTNSSDDQISLEFPLLINLFDERNIFISRRALRKGINTFVRMGLIPSVTLPEQYENTILNNEETVVESLRVRPFNLLGSYSIGLMRRFKSGNVALFEISANVGILPKIEGDITYRSAVGPSNEKVFYQDNGSYVAMNVIYFWKRRQRSRRPNPARLPPIIYHPRQSI